MSSPKSRPPCLALSCSCQAEARWAENKLEPEPQPETEPQLVPSNTTSESESEAESDSARDSPPPKPRKQLADGRSTSAERVTTRRVLRTRRAGYVRPLQGRVGPRFSNQAMPMTSWGWNIRRCQSRVESEKIVKVYR
jgi:hypothetical protein